MTVVVGDRIKVDVVGDHQDTDEVVMSYQLRMMAGDSMTDGEAMLGIVDYIEYFWTLIEDLYNIYVNFREIRGQDVDTSRLLPPQTLSPPLVGVNPGDASPAQATWPLSLKTTTPRVTLRKHFGPTSEGALDTDGLATVAVEAALAAAGVYLLATQPTAHGAWRYGYESPVALGWVEPSSAQFTRVPGSLRRRRLGQGS